MSLALCVVTVCLFVFGVSKYVSDVLLRTTLIVCFTVGICAYETITIVQHVQAQTNAVVDNMLTSAQQMTEASERLYEALEFMGRSADSVKDLEQLLQELAEACDDFQEGGNSLEK